MSSCSLFREEGRRGVVGMRGGGGGDGEWLEWEEGVGWERGWGWGEEEGA